MNPFQRFASRLKHGLDAKRREIGAKLDAKRAELDAALASDGGWAVRGLADRCAPIGASR